jgi:DNA/RNA-binding domain of Phe-tRNA-synthetase-like protein
MSVAEPDLEPEEGWIEAPVAQEFPGLRLLTVALRAGPGPSLGGARRQLQLLSDRFRGNRAISLRGEPVPHAYRVFFRSVGLDPDATRTPIEAAVLDRLMEGGFRAQGRIEDALLIALVETGVPVWALDDERLDGPLGIRMAHSGERLGEGDFAPELRPGALVVADAAHAVAQLFGAPVDRCAPAPKTARVRLFTLLVPGVPRIYAEEALWLATASLGAD